MCGSSGQAHGAANRQICGMDAEKRARGFVRWVGVAATLATATACGGAAPNEDENSATAGGTQGSGGSGAAAGSSTTGGSNAAGTANSGGSSGASAGSSNSGGTDSGGGGSGGTSTDPLPPDPCIAANTCPAGTWVEVTPPEMAALDFGNGAIVVDPLRPSDLYMGGGGDGLWKSTDYGNTWSKISDAVGYVPAGIGIVVLPGTPATIWGAAYKVNRKSTDGGETFTDVAFDFPDNLYSIQIDPYDATHLISGLHEVDGIVESTDSGDTWQYVAQAGAASFPTGSSWYAFFVDTGDAETTRGNWLAISQSGGGTVMTSNSGGSWSVPNGVSGLEHAHGNAQIHQQGDTLWLPGVYGPGSGVYKSTDLGQNFTRVMDGSYSVAWGTEDNVYAMWGWACADCDLGASFSVAPLPAGDTFTQPTIPEALNIGPRNIAITSDGNHNIFVGTMWASGVWRYVEP
jgi:hypothetical protein